MPRKNLFEQLRGAFSGVVETVQNLFGRGKTSPESDADLPPIQVPEPIERDKEQASITVTSSTEESEPTQVHDPLDDLSPEEIEDLETDDAPVFAPSDFDSGNLRRIFATLSEAENYALEIPIPTTVFKRSTDLLYQVAVEYP